MARRSKEFGELVRQQRREKDQQETLDKLARRVKRKLKETDVIINPNGEVKMSEVLQAFIEPYLDFAIDRDQREKMFTIAIFAWNLALLPPEQQQQATKEMIDETLGKQDRQAKQDMREIVEELIERKRKFFPDNQRYILDFELKETRNDFYLSVISAPTPKDEE